MMVLEVALFLTQYGMNNGALFRSLSVSLLHIRRMRWGNSLVNY